MGFRWLPNANEIYTKKRNVHGQRKKFAAPKERDTNTLVFFALGNAKALSFALGNAKLPDASSFASQWNIGFTLFIYIFTYLFIHFLILFLLIYLLIYSYT